MDLPELYNKLYRYCYWKLCNPQIAEDMTQETFLRFLRDHSSRELHQHVPYLYRIARNLCVDQGRGRQAEPLEKAVQQMGEDSTPGQLTRLALEQAMDGLPEEERELLFLRYTNQTSVGETAQILGLSRFAVYRRERRALQRLREQLDRGDFYD